MPASASGAPGYSVFYGYDIRGLQTYARFGSSSGLGILNTYDGFGRLASSTNGTSGVGRTFSYGYDTGSRRSRLTWPDESFVTYDYDAPRSLIAIRENGGAAVAGFTYDTAGRRSGPQLPVPRRAATIWAARRSRSPDHPRRPRALANTILTNSPLPPADKN